MGGKNDRPEVLHSADTAGEQQASAARRSSRRGVGVISPRDSAARWRDPGRPTRARKAPCGCTPGLRSRAFATVPARLLSRIDRDSISTTDGVYAVLLNSASRSPSNHFAVIEWSEESCRIARTRGALKSRGGAGPRRPCVSVRIHQSSHLILVPPSVCRQLTMR